MINYSWKNICVYIKKPITTKVSQPWIFIWRTDAEAKALILWPPDVKNWLTGEDPDAEKYWRQKKGTAEDGMVGWHHWLNEHESKQSPGDSEVQESLEYYSLLGFKASDMA